MDLNRLEAMLQEVSRLHSSPQEVNIFSIGSRGYYENPTSDLLAFFLNPAGKHGLGDLLLSSFAELLPDPPLAPLELEEPPIREYPTKQENRIDILLNGSRWVIAIENKLRHLPVNPFREYRDTITERFAHKRSYFVILSPDDPRETGWSWIPYRLFLTKAREKLGAKLIASGISKWGILLREFLINIDNEVGSTMDDEQFKFVQDHYGEIVQANTLHDAYLKRLMKEMTEVGAETLGADPTRVVQHDWGEVGIALRLYPRADQQTNSTLLVIPQGGFRVQFYVQTDRRRPNDASRDVFEDDGKFAFLGSELSFGFSTRMDRTTTVHWRYLRRLCRSCAITRNSKHLCSVQPAEAFLGRDTSQPLSAPALRSSSAF